MSDARVWRRISLIGLAFLSLFTATSRSHGDEPTLPSYAAAPLPTADPAAVGVSPEQLDRVTAYLQELMDNGQVTGGVIMMARHGKVVLHEAIGIMDREKKTPMREGLDSRRVAPNRMARQLHTLGRGVQTSSNRCGHRLNRSENAKRHMDKWRRLEKRVSEGLHKVDWLLQELTDLYPFWVGTFEASRLRVKILPTALGLLDSSVADGNTMGEGLRITPRA